MSDKEKIEGKENSDRKKGADLRRARELMGLTSIRPLIEYFELGPIIKDRRGTRRVALRRV